VELLSIQNPIRFYLKRESTTDKATLSRATEKLLLTMLPGPVLATAVARIHTYKEGVVTRKKQVEIYVDRMINRETQVRGSII
jgi:hypothetical protein